MKVLILGGTKFIGRHIVETLLAAGHHLTIFTRGKTPDLLPRQVQRLHGDRDEGAAGLDTLKNGSWDACIDVSGFTARHVRCSAQLLCDRVNRYIFISSSSVYGDPQIRPVRESHPLVPPAAEDVTEIDGDTYGPLKVTCETIVQEIFADRSTLLRPQIVAGPYDPSDRYSYWVRRATQPGPMIAPGDGSDHVQVIDARDIARFTKIVIEKNLSGPFNLAGPRMTWTDFLQVLGAQNLVWLAAEVIRAACLTESELPLFRTEHGPYSGKMDMTSDRAQAAGLQLSDPKITAQITRDWLKTATLIPALSPQREADLLRMANDSK